MMAIARLHPANVSAAERAGNPQPAARVPGGGWQRASDTSGRGQQHHGRAPPVTGAFRSSTQVAPFPTTTRPITICG